MQELHLVDLNSQITVVIKKVEGLSPQEIIIWLQRHGKVVRSSNKYLDDVYQFTSGMGIATTFRLTAQGEMYLISDHSLQQVR